MYAILDIETSGGRYNEEGITEIAIYRFDGHQVVDQFISLINPMRPIDPYVTKLTGIGNNMLRRAPRFHEVAKRIVEITDGCVIVAHNAENDYRIIRLEFARLGYEYHRDTLCTVALAQKLIPEQESYNLGNLAKSLGIPMSNQHRAFGDAEATVELFKILLEKDKEKNIIKKSLHSGDHEAPLPIRFIGMLSEVPSDTGVFYLYGPKNEVFYVGRAKDMHKEMRKILLGELRWSQPLRDRVDRVSWEATGSELLATIKEREQIALLKPPYNKRGATSRAHYGLYAVQKPGEYTEFEVGKLPSGFQELRDELAVFASHAEAVGRMKYWQAQYGLNPEFTVFTVYKKLANKVFSRREHLPVDEYNEKADHFIAMLEREKNMAVTDKGRTHSEKSVLLVRNGLLAGYAYGELNMQINNPEVLSNLITPLTPSVENTSLLHYFIRRGRVEKVIYLE